MSPGKNNISHHVCVPTASSSHAFGPYVWYSHNLQRLAAQNLQVLACVLKEHAPKLLVMGAVD